MKKTIGLFILFLLVMGLRGTGVIDAETTELRMAIYGSKNDIAIYEERIVLAEEMYPDIDVELIYIPGEYAQKVKTMIAGGQAPDIIMLGEDVHAYSSKGQIIRLDEYIKEYNVDLQERFADSVVAQYSYRGGLYAMPDRSGAMIVYYNKDMFDKAGVDYPDKDWTWDDLVEAGQKLTIREGDEVVQWGFAAGDWWPWWLSFIYQNGGEILNENDQPVVNTPEVIEALQFYNDLVYKYRIAPSLEDFANIGDPGPDPLFAQGKVAFQITGFWNVGSLKNVPELNWDIAPLWGNKKNATVSFGSGLGITKDSKNQEAAFRILEFLTSFAGQLPIVENRQDVPANLELQASDEFVNADWAAGKDINMDVFKESADIILTPPLHPQWNEIMKIFGDNLSEVFMNKRSVEDAVKEIQSRLEFTLF